MQRLVDGGEATAVGVLNASVVPPQLLQSPGQTGGGGVRWRENDLRIQPISAQKAAIIAMGLLFKNLKTMFTQTS